MFADEQPLSGTDINSLDKDRIQELVEKNRQKNGRIVAGGFDTASA